MRIDSQLVFIPAALAVLGATVYSTNVIDLLGLGVGVTAAAGNVIKGNATVFGADLGVGDGLLIPKLQVSVGTAFTTGNAATLTVQWQFAEDDGTGNPGSYQVFAQSPAMTAAQLTASTIIARMDYPAAFPENFAPRFTRLALVPLVGAFTAGTIAFAGIVPVRDDAANRYAAGNFTVADN